MISASDNSSTFLDFQLLASLGSFLMGAKGTATGAGAALGKKLDLAAVEATAGGKEGTVIWAKRAEGRVARTSCSAAGAALTGLDSTGTWTDSTLMTLIFFVLGVWAGGAAVAALGAADDRGGLDGAAALDAAAEAAADLTFTALAGTAGFGVGLALTAGLATGLAAGFATGLATALAATLATGFTGALALGLAAGFAAALAAGLAAAFAAGLAAGFAATLGAGLATALAAGLAAAFAAGFAATLGAGLATALAAGLAAALAVTALALAAVVLVLEATADGPGGFVLIGVFTSCLLAVSKGRLLTVCPCAADPKPVHMLLKPLL